MNSETFLWCMEAGLEGIVLGEDAVEEEPKLKAGRASFSADWATSTAETGLLRPVARE